LQRSTIGPSTRWPDKLPTVAEHLDAARADLLAFTAFPKQIWRQIWSTNPQERRILSTAPGLQGWLGVSSADGLL
jgi:transposase-like protein